ncbi:MAG: electron transfer flavoprotein subunit beta/FixA family protein [Chloroflexi bacterium]|nr:electron transfer flavoprotein subunit beta/FixA family protein [Chloroflexota bacterium]
MKMIVCVKQVPDPEAPPSSFKIDPASMKVIPPPGVAPVISPFDEQATEAALRIKDALGGTITVLSMGASLAREVVKKPLSMGADDLVLLEGDAFSFNDSYSVAFTLAQAIKKMGDFDLIFCGRQAADWDAGQTGVGIAEILGIPCVTVAKKVEVADGRVRVERVLPDGYEVVEAPMPCLITVSNELGEARYATLKGIMAAARKPVTVWGPADIGLDTSQVGAAAARSKLVKLFIPVREGVCEIMEGESVAEAAVRLAVRLREAKVI